jgi:membrane-associated phospholipid phosphatase
MRGSRILFLSSLLQFASLIPLAYWVSKHPVPLRESLLTRVFQRKQTSRKRSLVAVFNTLTGSSLFLNLLVVPVSALFWKMRWRREAFATLVTCWTSALAHTAIKRLVHRPRPPRGLVRVRKQSRGKSFPSGHVASSICLWGWICTTGLFARQQIRAGSRWLFAFPAAFIVLTGPARVYLGDHWASDVLGGYLFGGGWLSLSLSLYMQSAGRKREVAGSHLQ